MNMKNRINDKYLGIVYIIGAAFFFALMNLFVQLSGDVPVLQKCFFRNVVALVFTIGIIIKNREKVHISRTNAGFLLGRAFFGTLGLVCNFYAIDNLNSISDASMLNKLSPFFAILFSIILLKELPTRFDWLTVIIAFIGALFVIKPSMGMESIPAIVGTISGIGAGIAYTFVRKLGQTGEKSTTIVLVFSSFSTIILSPILIFDYHPMEIWQIGTLILAGLSATGGQFCITSAYKKAPAKEISVFDYTQVIFAALLGSIFLGQVPDILSYIGYIIIIGIAIIKWKVDSQQSRI